MSDTVIRVENLGKKYILGHQEEGSSYKTFRGAITDAAKSVGSVLNPRAKKARPTKGEFWALKDVSFEIKQGDRVGFVGRNGAGKSTLLKVLSRITEPTCGSIRIKGRVASLLEVGTGFHPELTGRENIFLNGAILGMSKVEIQRKFDEIVAFSEVEKFLDTPVKRYSSGMYVRLAFAVAAHLEPEILIVDEVLAVGDAQFQKKCLGKMEQVTDDGRTILFVSHNMTALESLCNKAVWLSSGKVVEQGSAKTVVSNYLTKSASALTEQVWNDRNQAPGNDKVRLHRVCVSPEQENPLSEMNVSTPIKLEFEYWNLMPNAELNFSVEMFNIQDISIFNVISSPKSFPVGLVKGVCHIPGNFLNDGTHRVKLMIVQDTSIVVFSDDNVLTFEINDVEREGNWYGKWSGVVRPKFSWDLEFMAEMKV